MTPKLKQELPEANHRARRTPVDFAYDHFNVPPGFVWVYIG